MFYTGGGQYLDFGTGTGRLLVDAPSPSRCRCRIHAQIVAVAVAAATLAACGGPAVVSNRSEWGTASNRHPAPARTAKHILSATKSAAKTSSYGVASFYKDDTETASGEKFDPDQLTAAHRTLPFGTRLRVTNVETGRSVTVRINDRGPYIPGRSVDLSYAAADTIGMVERGVTKVKVEVVR
jgi:rare lipoprotein A